jgi:4-amino-4-deoxy-L-arabinose transferase-like glycosyltransferase
MGWRFLAWAAGLTALGIILSLLAAFYTRQQSLLMDENYYYPLAEQITRGAWPDGYIVRPPLYPLYLAAIFGVFGVGFTPALVISSLLRGGLVLGVGLLGKRLVSRPAGLAAAALVAVYPMLIFTYTRFVSAIVYIPLFVLSFWLVERALASERTGDTIAAGAASGLAALARSTSLFFTIVVAIWIAGRKSRHGRFSKRNLATAGLLVATMLAVVSPWTVRNAVVHRSLILIDNSSAYNLWLITSGKDVREATKEWESWGGQGERQKIGYARWLERMRDDPGFHITRMATVIPKLFTPGGQPDTYALSTVARGGSGRENVPLRRLLKVLAPAVFWLVMAGGLVGLALFERRPATRNLYILTVAYFILLHAATLARPRFLLPMNAVLAVYSGALIAAALSRLGSTRRGRPSP